MKICYFGTYHSSYPGNSLLIKGLRLNNVEVIECHVPLGELSRSKFDEYQSLYSKVNLVLKYLLSYIELILKYRKIGKYDAMIVGYLGQFDVFLARLIKLFSKRPIIFNPMFSLYDTIILDRQIYKETSFPARLLFYLDKYSFILSDITFLDSREHIKIWTDVLHCPSEKVRQLNFGADDGIFYPNSDPNRHKEKLFRVLFYGTFMPSQGIPVIIRAAKILENKKVIFKIIGYGQVSNEVEELAEKLKIKNIEFIKWVEFDKLPDHIEQAEVCLGMFGTTPKTKRCFANKVVQALAMGKPVITGDTPASREFLSHKENVLFCETGNPDSLAEAILLLRDNQDLTERIGNNGYKVFCESFSPIQIGSKAKIYLERTINKGSMK